MTANNTNKKIRRNSSNYEFFLELLLFKKLHTELIVELEKIMFTVYIHQPWRYQYKHDCINR